MKHSRNRSSGARSPSLLAASCALLLLSGCAKPKIEYRCPFGEPNLDAWAEVADGHLDAAPEVERWLMEVGRQCGWEGFDGG